LEYLKGNNLFQYLKDREFTLSEKRTRAIIYELAQGIKYIHSHGIIHRDLKLENIMMTDSTDEAKAKIVDFGLARILGPEEKTRECFGTFGY